jgi:hypothetical protein
MEGDTITATDEILPRRQPTETTMVNDPRFHQVVLAEQILAPRESVRAAAAARLAAADPKIRLVLRKHLIVPAFIISDTMTRVIAVAVIISLRLSGYSSAVSQRTNDLARDRALALTRARILDLDLAGDLDLASDLDLARILDRDLDLARILDRIRDLDRHLDRALDLDRDLARVLDLDRDLAVTLASVLTRARALARALASVLDLLDARARGRGHDLLLDLASDRDLDRALDRALIFVRAHDRDLARDRDLDLDIDPARELARVLAQKFGLQNTEGLASALLAGALDDFSHTDLSGIDLNAVDLIGIRWSARDTRWPPGTDIERLLSVSEETEPGSGLFVITGPGGTDRTREEVHV